MLVEGLSGLSETAGRSDICCQSARDLEVGVGVCGRSVRRSRGSVSRLRSWLVVGSDERLRPNDTSWW